MIYVTIATFITGLIFFGLILTTFIMGGIALQQQKTVSATGEETAAVGVLDWLMFSGSALTAVIAFISFIMAGGIATLVGILSLIVSAVLGFIVLPKYKSDSRIAGSIGTLTTATVVGLIFGILRYMTKAPSDE